MSLLNIQCTPSFKSRVVQLTKNCQQNSNSTNKTAVAAQQKRQHFRILELLCFASKIKTAAATAQQQKEKANAVLLLLL